MSRAAVLGGLVALALSAWGGYHVASLAGDAALEKAKAEWAKQREDFATARADAETAQRKAEQGQADALAKAADSYQKGKDDANRSTDQRVADLVAGNLRLRDEWATCRATSEALAAGVPSPAAGHRANGEDGLRAAGIGRILRIVGQCQAQRDALQQALMGEREGQ